MPIEVINTEPRPFGSFIIYSYSASSGTNALTGLSADSLIGMRLDIDAENGDRIIFDVAGTYQLSISSVVSMSSSTPTGTYDINLYARQFLSNRENCTNRYAYQEDGSHPQQGNSGVDQIDATVDNWIRLYTYNESSDYTANFNRIRLCVSKVS